MSTFIGPSHLVTLPLFVIVVLSIYRCFNLLLSGLLLSHPANPIVFRSILNFFKCSLPSSLVLEIFRSTRRILMTYAIRFSKENCGALPIFRSHPNGVDPKCLFPARTWRWRIAVREEAFDQLRWDEIERLEERHNFSLENLMAYVPIKIRLVDASSVGCLCQASGALPSAVCDEVAFSVFDGLSQI